MSRIAIISLLALASTIVASAGQIEIGGANGLTSTYVTSGCAGATCVAGSTGGATEQNYDTVLFQGLTGTNPAAGGTIHDSADNVTFAMMNGGGSSNFWDLPQSGNNEITVPIGLYGVTDVWTMINDVLAGDSSVSRDVTLFFNFGTTSNAATVDTITVKLTNAGNSSTAAGEDRNSVDCSPATTTPCEGTASPAISPLMSGVSISGVTVDTNNVYTSSFSDDQAGTLNLDDQGFLFNGISLASLGVGDTNLNTYLVSVQIKEASATAGGQGVALSAITVDTAPVPEPSTIMMMLTGLGVVGFAALRRRSA
jgi:PEP-CTERM motif